MSHVVLHVFTPSRFHGRRLHQSVDGSTFICEGLHRRRGRLKALFAQSKEKSNKLARSERHKHKPTPTVPRLIELFADFLVFSLVFAQLSSEAADRRPHFVALLNAIVAQVFVNTVLATCISISSPCAFVLLFFSLCLLVTTERKLTGFYKRTWSCCGMETTRPRRFSRPLSRALM